MRLGRYLDYEPEDALALVRDFEVVVVCGGLWEPAGLPPTWCLRRSTGSGEASGRLAAAAQLEGEGDDEVEQGGADGGAVLEPP
ncbi:hypothetical protein [Streptomyces sp. NBC_01483]|uniref:hypothetical protein n=1 Tax=Streptomyces sp. NBC_01483 TaxID=2903883 RepID=UPI002E353119|nr:hypothetical protein [Streptomyces sp. NBC_01483]